MPDTVEGLTARLQQRAAVLRDLDEQRVAGGPPPARATYLDLGAPEARDRQPHSG